MSTFQKRSIWSVTAPFLFIHTFSTGHTRTVTRIVPRYIRADYPDSAQNKKTKKFKNMLDIVYLKVYNKGVS